jgi:hypothetical protein
VQLEAVFSEVGPVRRSFMVKDKGERNEEFVLCFAGSDFGDFSYSAVINFVGSETTRGFGFVTL